MRQIAFVALLCLSPVGDLSAQVRSRVTTSEIQVRHFTREQQGIYVKNSRGDSEEILPLRSGLVFDVGRDTEVRITVGDPNPLLYEYRWKGITAVNTPEYEALLTFAAALRDSQSGLPKIEARLAARPAADLDPVDKVLADASAVVSRLRDMAAGIETVILKSIESLEDAKTDGLALTSTLAADTKRALEVYRELRGLQLKFVADPQLGTAEQRANLALLLSYESELQRVVKELQVFREAVLQMNVPLLIGTVPYSGTQQQTALIEIASHPNARVKDPRVSDRGIGAYSFVVYPPISIASESRAGCGL